MPIINRIADFHDEMTAWRRDLHAQPETAFEEFRTSDFVARKLAEFGYEVHRGLAGTGVVGTLKGAKPDNGRAIGLRADMDALNMEEANTFSHRSRHKGKMHGCGHDGHTTMLLGAARYLAETRNFAGTIHLIFQPAEEGAGGGRRMVEDGLFEKFPVEVGVWHAQHAGNSCRLLRYAAGRHTDGDGPVRNSSQRCRNARGHAGTRHRPDRRRVAYRAGPADNREPGTKPADERRRHHHRVPCGDGRAEQYSRSCHFARHRAHPEPGGARHDRGAGPAHCCADCARPPLHADINYWHNYPPLVTDPEHTKFVIGVAEEVAGNGKIDPNYPPNMASEDFSFMLEKKPGAYVFIGNGPEDSDRILHNPNYDFNDEILPIGASYWARLVETSMAR